MFVLNTSGQYSWPVSHSVAADGGKFEKMTFTAKFKRLPQSKFEELVATEGMTDKAFCREFLVGWSDIKSLSGEDVAYSEEAREQLLDMPLLATTLVQTYTASLKEVPRKN